jgi:Acetyltransferase (GNAT) family
MVARRARGEGIGTWLVAHARDGAKAAGYEYLHLDFDEHLRPFYIGACGFALTSPGLLVPDRTGLNPSIATLGVRTRGLAASYFASRQTRADCAASP